MIEIEPEFGNDFSPRRLRSARQFYGNYPMWNAVRSELTWTVPRRLDLISGKDRLSSAQAHIDLTMSVGTSRD